MRGSWKLKLLSGCSDTEIHPATAFCAGTLHGKNLTLHVVPLAYTMDYAFAGASQYWVHRIKRLARGTDVGDRTA